MTSWLQRPSHSNERQSNGAGLRVDLLQEICSHALGRAESTQLDHSTEYFVTFFAQKSQIPQERNFGYGADR